MSTGISGSYTVFRASIIELRKSWATKLLRRDRLPFTAKSGAQGVPSESSAFNAHGILAHAGKDSQFAQIGGRQAVLRQHVVELFESPFSFGRRLSAKRFREQRSRGSRDGAT